MNGGRLLVAILVSLLLLFGVAAFLPAGRVLVVEVSETGEISQANGSGGGTEPGTRLLSVPVENGTHVVLAYTHSVEKTPVRDRYTVRGDRLVMTRMTFESYGWGLPASATVSKEDGQFVFDPPGNYTELAVSPGDVAGHRLQVGGRSYDLVERSGGSSVRIHLVRRSVLDAAIDSITPDSRSTTNASDSRSITTTGVVLA